MVNSVNSIQTVLLKPDFLQKDGLKCVSIKLDEIIERGKRLDASYFDIESKKARQIIAECPYPKLSLFGEKGFAQKVYYFPPFRRIFIKNGIPIYTASQILDNNPIPEKFISNRTKADLDALILKYGQIVMTRSGSIGFCSLVTETLGNKIFSDDVIRIECNDSKLLRAEALSVRCSLGFI